jgi:flagellar biosynthesis protein FlhA
VLAAHLAEVIKHNAHELLSRHETRRLIDRLSESHPKLADDLIPKLMSLGEVQRVLQQLLREQVSIRDLGTILETLVDTASFNKNQIALVEAVRHSQGRALIRPLLNDQGQLKVVTLDTAIEDECLRGSNLPANQSISTPQQVTLARRVLDGLRGDFGKDIQAAPPVLLCSSPGRYYLHRLLEPFIPRIVVISPGEIPALTPVQSVGVIH